MRTLKTLILAAAITTGGLICTGTAHAQTTFRELAKQGEAKKALALVDEGNEHKAFGEYTEALGKYEEALTIDANCAPAYVGVAWVRNEQKEYGKAKDAANAAIKADAKCGAAYRELGFAEWHQGETKAAKEALEAAVGCDGTDLPAYAYLIDLLEETGEKKAAGEYKKHRDAEVERQANPEQKKTIY